MAQSHPDLRFALQQFKSAVGILANEWSRSQYDGDEIDNYPECLPSFDEFALQVPAMTVKDTDPAPFADRDDFIAYLEQTLIPDLRDAGRSETARDFETAIQFMRATS